MSNQRRYLRYSLFSCLVLGIMAMSLAACGSGPTPTPTSTNTPTPTVAGTPNPQPSPTATPTSAATPTPSFDAASYFKGKTVKLIVGFAPGGGFDTISRITAEYISKYLPGNPRIVVSNVTGSGGITAANVVFASKPDGLTVGILHGREITNYLFGGDIGNFDPHAVRMIGTPQAVSNEYVYCTRTSVATSWSDIESLGRPVTDGETAPGFTGALGPTLLEMIGDPIKMVYGYGGTSEIMAAVDRGELDGTTRCTSTGDNVQRLYPQWLNSPKYLTPIFQYGTEPALQSTLDMWGVSSIPQLTDIVNLTDTQKRAFNDALNFRFSKTFWLPPSTSDDIYQTWVDAFKAVTNDPDWQKAMQTGGYDIGIALGPELQQQLTTLVQEPKDVLDIVKVLLLGS